MIIKNEGQRGSWNSEQVNMFIKEMKDRIPNLVVKKVDDKAKKQTRS